MKEKIIVALATINLTLLVYIWELPNRVNLRPGGEIFIPLYVLVIWYIGHEMQKQIREDKQRGRR